MKHKCQQNQMKQKIKKQTKKKKNSLTSTFLFSMAGTWVCVSEAADPEVHLTLRQWFSIRAVGQNTHTHTAVQDLCKH